MMSKLPFGIGDSDIDVEVRLRTGTLKNDINNFQATR